MIFYVIHACMFYARRIDAAYLKEKYLIKLGLTPNVMHRGQLCKRMCVCVFFF